MSSINTYVFSGRLGADAELKFTQSGTAIWSARVAVDFGFGDNKGTNWITAKAFGKRAEGLGKLELVKGTAIGGSGALQVREFERNGGGKGTSVEVIVDDVALFGSKPISGSTRAPAMPALPNLDRDDDGQDIPF